MKLLHISAVSALLLGLGACSSLSPNTIQLAQERHSCASLGIDPGSEAFATCVGNLDATMFEANNAAAR